MSLPGGIAPLPASIDRGIATSILGSLFATILYGLTSHQAFRYLRVFQGDPSYLKVLVTVLWTLLTISSMSIMHLNYYYFVTKRSQVQFLSDAVWSVDVIIVTSCAITCASRLFFAQRLHILTTLRYFISAPIAAAVFVRAALCIAYICRGLQMWGRDSVAEKLYGTGLAISVVADTTIAAMLSYYLAKGKRKFTSYDNHFDRILTYTVNAGILATFFSLTTVICMYTTNSLLVTIALCHLTDQLYVNSVMTVMHCRQSPHKPSGIGSFGMGGQDEIPHGEQKHSSRTVKIHITRETHTLIDTTRGEITTSDHHGSMQVRSQCTSVGARAQED